MRRTVLSLNVPGFITYAQTIGYNVLNQLPSGTANVISRVRQGSLNPVDTLGKIWNGLGHASLLTINTFVESFSFIQGPVSLVAGAAKGVLDIASGAVCSITGGAVHLPGTTCERHGGSNTSKIETVRITTR